MQELPQAVLDAMDAIIPEGGGYGTTIAEARQAYAASQHTRLDWVAFLSAKARIESLVVTSPDVDHVEAFTCEQTGVEFIYVDDVPTPVTAVAEIEARRLRSLLDQGIRIIHQD